jgi:GrpB-like predicted nucleotidyltransferase (UPF0157 family)
MSESQIFKRKNRPYKLLPYDPKWAHEFIELKSSIAPLYGHNLLDFQHIGSTSIPGMLAKPVIDVCAVVKDIEEVKAIRPKFEALGYRARGDYVGQGEEYFTYDDANGERKYNIHTLQEGNLAIIGYLSFRDYLRSNEEAVRKYIEGLRNLYGASDYNSYDWNKGDRIEYLKRQAREWYKTDTTQH